MLNQVGLLVCWFCLMSCGCVGALTTNAWPTTDAKSLQSFLSESTGSDRKSRNSQASELCIKTAREMEGKGYVDEAIALYERAIADRPNDSRILHRLGTLSAKKADVANARKYFEQAISIESDSAPLNNDFGFFCMQQGELARAESLLKSVVQKSPSNTRAINNLAKLMVQTDRSEAAYELLEAKLGPAAAHSNVGVLLAKQGNQSEAEKHLSLAQSLSKDLKSPAAFLSYYQSKDESSSGK